MAKESGLGWTTLSLDDASAAAQVIKNDVTNFEFATPRGVQEVTVFRTAWDMFAASLKTPFRPHAVLKTVPSTSVQRTLTLAVSGQTLANEVLVTDYSLNRAEDGSLTWSAPCLLADGTVPTWS